MIARALKVLFTLLAVAVAGLVAWKFYDLYSEHPWTRDGQVRAYVVGIAARVDGPMTQVYVQDNQWVAAGDPLFQIDPTDYEKEAKRAEAAREKAKTVAANLSLEVERRRGLVSQELISLEEFQTLESQYVEAVADIAVAEAELELARLYLSYTRVLAPVSGYITNLEVTAGTYVHVGQPLMALVDASSFWISAYFKETDLGAIQPGDRVRIVMMGDLFEPFPGVVESVGWGVYRADGSSNPTTQLPMVKPTVDWVRLAQRFPVRVRPLELPEGIQLRVGQTVSVLVDPLFEAGSKTTDEASGPPPANGYPLTLTDGRGDETILPAPPGRVLSLAPSTTQWLRALGADGLLVGATEHCELAPGQNLPRFATYPEPAYEAVVAAAPDLIVTADIADPRHVKRLRELGQRVLVLNHDGYDGILRDAQTLGAALGRQDEASDIIAQLKADRAAVKASVADRASAPRALLALSPSLEFAAGSGSYADSLLRLAGAENVAADAPGQWPQLSREFIAGATPNVILVSHPLDGGPEVARAETLAALQGDPVWRELPAVRAGRVAVIDSQLLNVPGPRVGEALKALQAALAAGADGPRVTPRK